jgi:cellulose synthase/poly-beta-1,6-N-acetylglucosamine synthase-like glycosyltransferase
MCLRVSLVIPLYNEEPTVDALLRSVAEQRRQPDEVVCVDAGSTDRTADLVYTYTDRIPILLLKRARLYPGEARNEGVSFAQNPWIAFADGGTSLDRDWLSELVNAASTQPVDVVLGTYEPICEAFFEECAALAYVPCSGANGLRRGLTASSLLRRQVILELGGFRPYRAAEDLDFLDRLERHPYRIAHAPRAIARWHLAPDLRRTFVRFTLYSYHNLSAGRAALWHLGLLRQYAALISVGILLVVLHQGRLCWALFPGLWLARSVKAAWSKRNCFSFSTLSLPRLLTAAGILCLIDVATAVGAVCWALGWTRGRAQRSSRPTP